MKEMADVELGNHRCLSSSNIHPIRRRAKASREGRREESPKGRSCRSESCSYVPSISRNPLTNFLTLLPETIATSRVTIKRVERNKRKYVTAVIGLEAFGLDLKKVAKDFGKKFATGASVTKLANGESEIVVQGDVSEEIEEFLLEKWGDVIPEDNVELVEDKKKKGAAAAV